MPEGHRLYLLNRLLALSRTHLLLGYLEFEVVDFEHFLPYPKLRIVYPVRNFEESKQTE